MLNTISGMLSGAVAGTDYESIQTINVGSGGSATVEFTSIPSTYTHLQIRLFAQSNRGTYNLDDFSFWVGNGSVDTGANYSDHQLSSDFTGGTTVQVGADVNSTIVNNAGALATVTGGQFAGGIIDFLDYANTNKNKTFRILSGMDTNGTGVGGYTGFVRFASGAWRSNSAITNIKLRPNSGSAFTQYSSFALYGIK